MEWWKGYPWRMVQTNLREIDFQDLDPERYVADLKSFHATVAMINAGGISASYPTALPWHAQNPLAMHDGLKRTVELCHENGIRVLARTDFSKVKAYLFQQHPQWAFRQSDGGIMNYNGYVQTCPNSEYQQEYAFKTLEEIFTSIPFDGLYCNMGGFQTRDYSFVDYGFCHCQTCRRLFREMSGYDNLPEKEDYSDPVYVAYTVFQKKCTSDYRNRMVKFLKNFDRDLCFDDEDYARIEASTELHRRLPHWQYHASSNCRAILGDGSREIICSNTSVDYMGYALRDVAVSPAQQKLRSWQNIANLGALDYYIMGRMDNHLDRSGFAGIREVFEFHKNHQQELLGMKNLARVLLRREDRWVATPEEKGWIRVLTENHIPFAEVLPTEFAKAALWKYDLIILPDNQFLTQEEIEQIDLYVAAGGTALLIGGTGLSDDRMGRKQVPDLKCQGLAYIQEEREQMASAMFLMGQDEAGFFPSNPESQVIALGDRYLFVQPQVDTHSLLKMVPVHPFGPPECCYFTEVTDYAGIYVHPWGKGKAVTLPWYPGEFFSRTGFENLGAFMKDVLEEICGAQPVARTLTPMVEVTFSGNKQGDRLLQMVNHSGIFGVSFVQPLPLGPVTLQVPWEGEPEQVYSLCRGAVSWHREGDALQVQLQELNEYNAIMIRGREV